MKKLVFLFVLVSFFAQAQDLLFLNSNQSLINLNPSFAGSNGFIRNQTSFRKLIGYEGGPQTFGNSFDMFLRPLNGGVAVSFASDAIGPLRNDRLSISYAQYLSFYKDNLKIIPSLQATHDSRHISSDWIYNNSVPTTQRQILFGGGLLVNYKNKLYVGTYFREQGRTIDRERVIAAILHASYTTSLNESVFLQFSGRCSTQRAYGYYQVGVNSVFQKRVIAGIQYITYVQAPVFNLGYRGDLFSVVAGYDFTVSKLAGNHNGYGELHFSYNLRQKGNRHPATTLGFESF